MGHLEYFPDGTVVPANSYRAKFAHDLRETIMKQMLKNQALILEHLDDGTLSCKLPPSNQLLDFVTLKGTEKMDELEVHVMIPSHEDDTKVCYSNFNYLPPR